MTRWITKQDKVNWIFDSRESPLGERVLWSKKIFLIILFLISFAWAVVQAWYITPSGSLEKREWETVELILNSTCSISNIIWSQTYPSSPNSLSGVTKTNSLLSFIGPEVSTTSSFAYQVNYTEDCCLPTHSCASIESNTKWIAITDSPTANAWNDEDKYIGNDAYLYGSADDFTGGCNFSYQWTETTSYWFTMIDDTSLYPYFSTTWLSPGTATLELEIVATSCTDSGTYTDTVDIFLNNPPTVNAGINQTVTIWDIVYLSGSIENKPSCWVDYYWNENTSYGITINNSNSLTWAYFDTSSFTGDTIIDINLDVYDDYMCYTYWYYADNVEIKLNLPVIVPTADAGADQSVIIWDTVNLSGSTTDFDPSCSLAYNWTETTSYGFTINNPTSLSTANFDSTELTTGTATIELEVTANSCAEEWSYTDIMYVELNTAPIIDAWNNQSIDIWDTVNLTGSTSNFPIGCALMYDWTEISSYGVTINNSYLLTWASFDSSSFTSDAIVTINLEVIAVSASKVMDSCGVYKWTYNDTSQVNINTPMITPTVYAGVDQIVTIWDTVNLSGSTTAFSTGCVLLYDWVETSSYGVVLTWIDTLTPYFDTSSLTGNSIVNIRLDVTANSAFMTHDTCYPQTGSYNDTVTININEASVTPPSTWWGSSRSHNQRMHDDADRIFRDRDSIEIILGRNPYFPMPFMELEWTYVWWEWAIRYELQMSETEDFEDFESYIVMWVRKNFTTYDLNNIADKLYFRVRATYKLENATWSNTYKYVNWENPLASFEISCIDCDRNINFEDVLEEEDVLDVECVDCDREIDFEDIEEEDVLDIECIDCDREIDFGDVLWEEEEDSDDELNIRCDNWCRRVVEFDDI